MDERDNEENQNRRPTPVRMVMDSGEEEEGDAGKESKILDDPSTGDRWIARVSGRSTGGVLPLRTIPLMEVSFHKDEESGIPLRHAVWQGASLDELDEGGLLRLFQASKPYSPPKADDPVPDRKKRKGRSRRGG